MSQKALDLLQTSPFGAALLNNSLSPRGLNKTAVEVGREIFAAKEYRAGHVYVDGMINGGRYILQNIDTMLTSGIGNNPVRRDILLSYKKRVENELDGLFALKRDNAKC